MRVAMLKAVSEEVKQRNLLALVRTSGAILLDGLKELEVGGTLIFLYDYLSLSFSLSLSLSLHLSPFLSFSLSPLSLSLSVIKPTT